jgi:hypothetical protein
MFKRMMNKVPGILEILMGLRSPSATKLGAYQSFFVEDD